MSGLTQETRAVIAEKDPEFLAMFDGVFVRAAEFSRDRSIELIQPGLEQRIKPFIEGLSVMGKNKKAKKTVVKEVKPKDVKKANKKLQKKLEKEGQAAYDVSRKEYGDRFKGAALHTKAKDIPEDMAIGIARARAGFVHVLEGEVNVIPPDPHSVEGLKARLEAAEKRIAEFEKKQRNCDHRWEHDSLSMTVECTRCGVLGEVTPVYTIQVGVVTDRGDS